VGFLLPTNLSGAQFWANFNFMENYVAYFSQEKKANNSVLGGHKNDYN
jgi:hypothetical protein